MADFEFPHSQEGQNQPPRLNGDRDVSPHMVRTKEEVLGKMRINNPSSAGVGRMKSRERQCEILRAVLALYS